MSSDISADLARYRLERNLRQSDVAKALGVTQQTVANWESGKPPKGARLTQLRLYMNGHDHEDIEPVKIERPLFFGRDQYHNRVHELNQEFIDSLPSEASEYVNAQTRFGGYTWRCDYLSPKVCAEIEVQSAGIVDALEHTIETSLLSLAVLRSVHQMINAPREHYALIVIGQHLTGRWGYARLQSAATAFGITIYHVPDPPAAAALVADLEFGPLK